MSRDTKQYRIGRQLNQTKRAEIYSNNYNFIQLDSTEAMGLISELIELFHVDKESIEVIYFPEDSDRATVLRAAADRLDNLNDKTF